MYNVLDITGNVNLVHLTEILFLNRWVVVTNCFTKGTQMLISTVCRAIIITHRVDVERENWSERRGDDCPRPL